MARTTKKSSKKALQQGLLRRVSLPFGVAIIAFLTPLAFAFAVLALNAGMQEPAPISYEKEATVRNDIFEKFKSKQATEVAPGCTADRILEAQHSFERENIRINRAGDRAIYRFCNNDGLLLAKTSDGTWFSLSSIDPRPEGAQDFAVRKVCKIEDITLGFNDTFPENTNWRDGLKHACRNIDATYTARL